MAETMPKRCELWNVRFDPSVGAEITKIRPAVVISENAIGKLPLRIVVPVTDWKSNYGTYPWFVKVEPNGILTAIVPAPELITELPT